eukprot:scaffold512_cov305-Chaetoceros_neogracile.AAC.1
MKPSSTSNHQKWPGVQASSNVDPFTIAVTAVVHIIAINDEGGIKGAIFALWNKIGDDAADQVSVNVNVNVNVNEKKE